LDDEISDEFTERGFGGSSELHFDLEYYLSHVLFVIEKFGYTPKSKAHEGKRPTSDLAVTSAVGTPMSPPEELDPKYKKEAKKIVTYLRNHFSEIDDKGMNDFQWNLYSVTQAETFRINLTGFAAYLVPYYRKLQEQVLKQKENKSLHVGRIGDMLEVDQMKLIWKYEVEGYRYGDVSYMYKFQDTEGNMIMWKTGSNKWADLDLETIITGRFTVTKHEVFNNEPQTWVKYKSKVDIVE
jgi:hypothetical protein